jgi:hypothetical protein
MYRVTRDWNKRLDPVRFVESGDEPDIPTPMALQQS